MSDRLRRLLMTGDTVGGVWNFTMELAAALGEHHVEVILASLGGQPSEAQRWEAAKISNLTLLTSDWKLEWMEDPWRDVEESGTWLLEIENEYAPDVVHLNSFGHGTLPWQTPVVLTAHSCVASWWPAVKYEPVPPAWERYRRTVKSALNSAQAITAPSEAMLRTLHENYGVDSGHVIPNGRRADRFRMEPKEPFLLTAGRLWDEAKNIAAVAKAAQYLPWPVYLAGDAPEAVKGCRMLGRLSSDELAGWYARAAIYALPARYEPFGLSVLEAALSGCALVLGDIPSLRELWGGVARFVPPDDSAALIDTCRDLIEHPAQRESLAHSSLNRARTFTPERMASAYLDTYQLAMKESYACSS